MPAGAQLRVLYLTKFPPLQGGMSARGWFTATTLACRGHTVRVITDALAAGSHERVPGRISEVVEQLPQGVSATWTETGEQRQYRRHPSSRPAVTQLASLALRDVAVRGEVDVVLAAFIEPYGVAGHLVAQQLGVPFVLAHAGSDVGRLMAARDAQHLYAAILRDAAVLSMPSHAAQLSLLQPPPARLHPLPVPAPAWMDAHSPVPAPRHGTLLVYGKLPGADILRALADTADATGRVLKVVGQEAWPGRDPLPVTAEPYRWPWDVPELLDQAAAVSCLEAPRVEIQGHQGLRPLEAAAAGRVVATARRSRDNFGMPADLVPTTVEELRRMLTDPARLSDAGLALRDWLEHAVKSEERGVVTFDRYIDHLESVLRDPYGPPAEHVRTVARAARLLTDPGPTPTDVAPTAEDRIWAAQPAVAVMDELPFGAVFPPGWYVSRRVAMKAAPVSENRWRLLAASAGTHRKEFLISAAMLDVLRCADGYCQVQEITGKDAQAMVRLQDLHRRSLVAFTHGRPMDPVPQLELAGPGPRKGTK